jgi:hypothetical protein
MLNSSESKTIFTEIPVEAVEVPHHREREDGKFTQLCLAGLEKCIKES